MNTEELRIAAAAYGTPTYIFDVREVEARIRLLRSLLPEDTGLCFAVKANPFLIPYVADMVDRLEVCSPGEYEICIQEQIAPEKIVVSGVNKTYESMKRILSYSKGAGIYTIESEEHAKILRTLAEKNQMPLSVLIRLSSGNQFGVDAETFIRLAKEVQESPYLTLAGVHYYAGTQKRQSKLEKEMDALAVFAETFESETGMKLPELEYGAGMKVSYFVNDSEKDQRESEPEPQIQTLAEKLRTCDAYSKKTIELGRFLVSMSGYYLTRVMDVKRTAQPGFVILDGGIHQINYYGWMMGMKQPEIKVLAEKDGDDCILLEHGGADGKSECSLPEHGGADRKSECNLPENSDDGELFHLCGSLCTVNDVLARDVTLHNPEKGDVICFKRCGAYAATEGMAMFLSRELPQVLICGTDGKIEKLRDRVETYPFHGSGNWNRM